MQVFGDCSMKASPSKTKNSYENLSPLPTLSYTIIKIPKEFFAPQKTANLVTFTEEILNGKLLFLCSIGSSSATQLLN